MAGDWMMIDLELADKPEVHQIAAILSLDCDAVVGKLIRVWSWFDKQTVDGNAPSVTDSLIDRLAARNGFASAMSQAGWMSASGTGLSMPNFDRWNGKSAKKRALSVRRVQRWRNADVNAVSVPKAQPEKRREEKKQEPPPDGGPVWGESLTILTEGGFSEKSARSFLGLLCRDYDEALVVEAVKSSMGKADRPAYIRSVLRSQPKKGDRAVLKVAMP